MFAAYFMAFRLSLIARSASDIMTYILLYCVVFDAFSVFQNDQSFLAYFDALQNSIGVEKEASNYEVNKDDFYSFFHVPHVKHFRQD